MNGIEKITQRIEEQTQLTVDTILSDAKANAESISMQYQERIAAEVAELTAKNEKIAVEREERLISAAQMEARKTILAAKQEMVEQTYIRALEKMCSMPDEQYISVLAKLMVEAASGDNGEVLFSAADRLRVGAAAVEQANALSGKKLRLSEDTVSIQGGFILRNKNVEVNCAFETLVRLQKAETAGVVAKKLFPEA